MKPPRPLVPSGVEVLEPLVAAGVLGAGEITVADALVRLESGAVDPAVVQGIAMAVLGLRQSHSCVDLARAEEMCAAATSDENFAGAGLPTVADWIVALEESELVTVVGGATSALAASDAADGPSHDRPLVLDPGLGRLWLARYATYEQTLSARLATLTAADHPFADDATIAAALDGAFAGHDSGAQRTAVEAALRRRLSFVVGGPGTGKTWTVGRLLDAVEAISATGAHIGVALAAPTGKAAERLTEAVEGRVHATTIHRLLGLHPGDRPSVDAPRRLTAELVVVDEASMIDLTQMTRLVGALSPEAHIVFVGDPDQLLSVEVGSVLRDVVDAATDAASPLHGTVVELDRTHRFGGSLGDLAAAVRSGDAASATALLADATLPEISLVDPTDPGAVAALFDEAVAATRTMVDAARDGRADDALVAARAHKVLTATRQGRFGLEWWNDHLGAACGYRRGEWKPGRPLIVTRNDPANGVFNGDTGVVVPGQGAGAEVQVALAGPDGARLVAPSRLRHVEDWWAMTVHKSQGSEFDRVVVALPEVASPILTRELLYTAVTRARSQVTVLGRPELVTAAIERRVERASGLDQRLR